MIRFNYRWWKRVVIAWLLVPVMAQAELIVIYDSGDTRPIAPFLGEFESVDEILGGAALGDGDAALGGDFLELGDDGHEFVENDVSAGSAIVDIADDVQVGDRQMLDQFGKGDCQLRRNIYHLVKVIFMDNEKA